MSQLVKRIYQNKLVVREKERKIYTYMPVEFDLNHTHMHDCMLQVVQVCPKMTNTKLAQDICERKRKKEREESGVRKSIEKEEGYGQICK